MTEMSGMSTCVQGRPLRIQPERHRQQLGMARSGFLHAIRRAGSPTRNPTFTTFRPDQPNGGSSPTIHAEGRSGSSPAPRSYLLRARRRTFGALR